MSHKRVVIGYVREDGEVFVVSEHKPEEIREACEQVDPMHEPAMGLVSDLREAAAFAEGES